MSADESNTDPEVRTQMGFGWMLLLFVGTLLLYARTVGFDFVHYDDDVFVFENPHVNGGLTRDGIAWALGVPDIDYWRPLTWISHMIDVELFGLRAGGHHFVSALWHAVNAVLLFVFLHQVTGRRVAAFAVAALFAWHPLRVESVAWIAERKDVMCGCFWFLTLIAYARFARVGGWRNYLGALVAFALGLSCKPMIITLPFQLLLLDVWPLRRWFSGGERAEQAKPVRLLLEKLPFLILALIGAVGVVLAQNAVGAMKSTADYSLVHRAGNALLSYLGYLEKTFWPTDLICFYEHPVKLPTGRLLTAVSVVLGASVFALLSLRRLPVLFSGWFWFLGTLVPVIGLLQVGDQAMADRYTYVALIGVYWVVAFGADQMGRTLPGAKWFVVAALVLALAACGYQSWRQLAVWRNSETLFTHALMVNPNNRLALNNLAYLHFTRGEDDTAAELYRRYLAVDPGADRAHYNLAEILERSGRPAEAVAHWRELVTLAPEFRVGWIGLVRSRLAAGEAASAVRDAVAAMLQLPEDPKLLLTFADLLRASGSRESVVTFCRAVLERRPRDFAVHAQLLAELRQARNEAEAVVAAERLLQLFPDAAEAHYHAALVFREFGRDTAAEQRLQEALRLNPGFATARLEMARLLATARDDAVRDPVVAELIIDGAEKALGMKLPQTLEVRAELAWREQRRAEAVALMSAAIERAREMNLAAEVDSLTQRWREMKAETEK